MASIAKGRVRFTYSLRYQVRQLSGVHYRRFPWEATRFASAPEALSDTTDGEIVLLFTDRTQTFVSWQDAPDETGLLCTIELSSKTFFIPDAKLETVEVSASPLWQPLLGAEVSITYVDFDRSAIEVRGNKSLLFCYLDRVGAIHIARHLPRRYLSAERVS